MVATVVVSFSELFKALPDITQGWCEEVENKSKLEKILWGLGLDIYKPWERQSGLIHRNRLNEVILCDRWVGVERLDRAWIESGYASREARNEASGSKLVQDLDPYKYHKL
jgi:hypothetical protein